MSDVGTGSTRRTPDWLVTIAMLIGVAVGLAFTFWVSSGTVWGAVLAGLVICSVFAIVAGLAAIWRDDLDV